MTPKILTGIVAALAVASFAVLATATGDGAPDAPTAAPPGESPAAPDPYVDFRVNHMVDRGVTPEMLAESERLGAELRAGARTASARSSSIGLPSFEQRLAWSRAAEAAARDEFRSHMAAGLPAPQQPVAPPTAETCTRLCNVLLRCSGQGDPAARRGCDEACRHGDLGGQWRAERIVELDSCDHL
jgi:hypothetical protein